MSERSSLPLLAHVARMRATMRLPTFIYNADSETNEFCEIGGVSPIWATHTIFTEQIADPTGDEQSDR